MPAPVSFRPMAFVASALLLLLGLTAAPAQATTPVISLSRVDGPPGSTIKVSGSGFGSSEIVQVSLDGTFQGQRKTDGAGTFKNVSVYVPLSAVPGQHEISATGLTSGLTAINQFMVRTAWMQFGYTPDGARYNSYENVLNTGNVGGLAPAFTASAPTGSFSTSVRSGIAYVAGKHLFAFNASTGAPIWENGLSSNAYTNPAVGPSLAYVGGFPSTVYAVNRGSGALAWVRHDLTLSPNTGTPVLANGYVYVAIPTDPDGAGGLFALNRTTGATVWTVPYSISLSTPAVSGSSLFVEGCVTGSGGICEYSYVEARDALTGVHLWTDTFVLPVGAAVAADGFVYVAGWDNNLYALDPSTGTTMWTAPIGGDFGGCVAASRTSVFVHSADLEVRAFDPYTGTSQWTTTLPGSEAATCPAVANGVLYVNSPEYVVALDGSSGTNIWQEGGTFGGGPIVVDGRVYANGGTSVYAYALP